LENNQKRKKISAKNVEGQGLLVKILTMFIVAPLVMAKEA
jgi:hypothetical protein